MAPLTPSRRRWTLTSVALAVLAAIVPAHAVSSRAVRCDYLVPSPTIATDRTIFCVDEDMGRSLTISVTSDLGRTWRTAATQGFTASDQLFVNGVIPSPAYGSDHQLFVQTTDALYVSTDAGATLSLVDPLGGQSTSLPGLVGLRSAPAALSVVNSVVLAQANQSNPPELVQPPLRSRAVGATGPVDGFLVAPSGTGPYAGTVIAVGRAAGSGAIPPQAVLYGCDEMLTCSTSLASLPARELVDEAMLGADFARTGVVTIKTTPQGGLPRWWLSRDAARHLRRVSGADELLRDLGAAGGGIWQSRLAADPSNARRLYLRVAVSHETPAVPAETMWRSDDDGAHWTRIGFFRNPGKPGIRGPRDWPGPVTSVPFDASMLVLGDRILSIGRDIVTDRSVIHCSTDGARTWSYACGR